MQKWDVFWVSKNQISMLKWVESFTFAYSQGRGGWPPSLTVSLTVKYPFFYDFPMGNKVAFLLSVWPFPLSALIPSNCTAVWFILNIIGKYLKVTKYIGVQSQSEFSFWYCCVHSLADEIQTLARIAKYRLLYIKSFICKISTLMQIDLHLVSCLPPTLLEKRKRNDFLCLEEFELLA